MMSFSRRLSRKPFRPRSRRAWKIAASFRFATQRRSFQLTQPADADVADPLVDPLLTASVVGRYLFYNGSHYDRGDSAISELDDDAIATDKSAYVYEDPNASTFANVSSYSKGINGIMLDISGPHGNITEFDFNFVVGNNNSPGLWTLAPRPSSVSVRAGAGVGGSDRVEIVWDDGPRPSNGGSGSPWRPTPTRASLKRSVIRLVLATRSFSAMLSATADSAIRSTMRR